MHYALLSSDRPLILRLISGFCISLGLFFLLPVVFFILLDVLLYLWRLYWNRPSLSALDAANETLQRDDDSSQQGDGAGADMRRRQNNAKGVRSKS
jgi:hypothetical protein